MKSQIINKRYLIKEVINEDLISYLYQAEHITTKESYWIWAYKGRYIGSKLTKKLIEVSEKVIKLNDKNILEMTDYCYDGESFYTIHKVSDRLETLNQWLEKKSRVDITVLWGVIKQVLSGLKSIESNRCLHGSINLENIYIDTQGQVKLGKVFLPLYIYKEKLNEFEMLEDCIFLPPEFLQHQKFNIRSDIYSFGILLYILFSGTWPYTYTANLQKLKKQLLKPAKPFVPVSAKIPQRLFSIIQKCICKESTNRFHTLSELIDAYKGDMDILVQNEDMSTDVQKDIEKSLTKTKVNRLKKVFKKAALALTVLVIIFFMNTLYTLYVSEIPDTYIPDLVGLTEAEALVVLDQNQLQSIIAGKRDHLTYDKDIIIETKPYAGKRVKVNRTVRLFLSLWF